jgi:[ribosomal protein S5]-alanine N-acetyltransferase
MPIIGETSRLLVRTWEVEDINELCDLTSQDGLADFSISSYANFSKEKALQWIAAEVSRFRTFRLGKFAVISKQHGKPIGISGLFHMLPPYELEVEINYRYPKVNRGKGFAVEAARVILEYGFIELKLREIHAVADLKNIPSQRVLEKLGMKKVEEISDHGVRAGHWKLGRPSLS